MNPMHPYRAQPPTAFWAKAVSEEWRSDQLLSTGTILLREDDRVASVGSCFAANLVPYLKDKGFSYVEKEKRDYDRFNALPENLSYDKFSAAYGNVYTARQFRQLLERALGRFHPRERYWAAGDEVVDPYRPGLRYRAHSVREFDTLTRYHLDRVLDVFREATVVIFTLGLTEAWVSKHDGAVFPACPGTLAGEFRPGDHVFHNFSAAEVARDLRGIHSLLSALNGEVRLILTVSPVPLVATATSNHVLLASTYSKSVLRVASAEASAALPRTVYFPAYEIVTGPQAPDDFFEADRRNVARKGVDAVMQSFFAHCAMPAGAPSPGLKETARREAQLAALSKALGDIECEEAAAILGVSLG